MRLDAAAQILKVGSFGVILFSANFLVSHKL